MCDGRFGRTYGADRGRIFDFESIPVQAPLADSETDFRCHGSERAEGRSEELPREPMQISRPSLPRRSRAASQSNERKPGADEAIRPLPPLPPLPSRSPRSKQISVIVRDLETNFAEFGWKRFYLWWRGSRQGFGSRDFHHFCDGHANTLTVILDTNDNIFDGFNPVAWDSTTSWKADTSLQSFLFTLSNPRNIPPGTFRF
jgi:hypothetical protein